MTTGCAVAPDLSRRDQRLRRVAIAADERSGQGRGDLGSASSACGPAAATWSSTGQVYSRGPGLPRGAAATPVSCLGAPAAFDRQPGYGAAMAPRSDAPTPCE